MDGGSSSFAFTVEHHLSVSSGDQRICVISCKLEIPSSDDIEETKFYYAYTNYLGMNTNFRKKFYILQLFRFNNGKVRLKCSVTRGRWL